MNWKQLHSYWFGDLSATAAYAEEREMLWFYKDPTVDEYIRNHFAPWLDNYEKGELNSWKNDGRGLLSLILLLDQVPRNSFRNNKKSFQYDGDALLLCLSGLGRVDHNLSLFEKLFFYLPLQHSESLDMQKKSIDLFHKMDRENSNPALKAFTENCASYADQHYKIIERFGRFPHRNKVLGRDSTPEELEFLKQPGSSF